MDRARRAGLPPGDRYRDGPLRRTLGRDRRDPRSRGHAVPRGLLHAVPFGRPARRLERAAARAVRAGGGAARPPARAPARGEQRRGAPRPAVRVRPRAAGRVPVRRLSRRGLSGAAAGREHSGAGARGPARRGGRERELQRRVARHAAHHGGHARHRLRRRTAALPRPVGARGGAAPRPALPDHRRRHDGSDDGRDWRRAGAGGRRGDADRHGGRRADHPRGIRGLVRRAAARGPHVPRAPAAPGLRVKRAAIIVLDGLGIGACPDQAAYGDAGSDTLGNVARAVGGLRLPNLERLGLGWCRPILGLTPGLDPGLAPGISRAPVRGSDPGHKPGVAPVAAYGVALPKSQGKDSTTGHWEICGVVLDRPFRTYPNGFPTSLLDPLAAAGVPRVGIGKVDDLFAGRNITSEHTPTNGDAYRLIERALDGTGPAFIFVNVIEFDQTWGHRNDVPGFHQGLKELDAWIPRLEARVKEHDLIIITADHGNDPTTPSTDHSREAVPILALGP